jgi:hypothetical protein
MFTMAFMTLSLPASAYTHPVTVTAEVLRLDLHQVKVALQRELGKLVFDCSACGQPCGGFRAVESHPAIGGIGSPPHGKATIWPAQLIGGPPRGQTPSDQSLLSGVGIGGADLLMRDAPSLEVEGLRRDPARR